MRPISGVINHVYRIIIAIGKEIISLQAAVCPEDCIRGYESPDVGVVVSGVEVVPTGLDVEVIAAVAERVDIRYVIRVVGHIVPAAVGDLPVVPPCVVLVLRHKRSRRIADRCYISLKVLVVPVLRSVVLKPYYAAGGVVYVVQCI